MDIVATDQNGSFTTLATVPISSSGQHTLKVDDGSGIVAITVTKEANVISGSSATSTPKPTETTHSTATPTATPAPTIPEYSNQTLLLLIALLTASLLIVTKNRKPKTAD